MPVKTYSEIEIIFNEDIQINSDLGFTVSSLDPVVLQNLIFKWTVKRSHSNEVTTGTPTLTAGERNAIEFAAAFNLDKNISNIYEITQNTNTVTIASTIQYLNFSDPFSFDDYTDQTNPNDVDFNISNNTDDLFNIESIVLSEAVNACDNIKITVTTSTQASEYQYNRVDTTIPINSNPFDFEVLRGGSITLNVYNSAGDTATQNIVLPDSYNGESFSLEINSNPEGSTVIINSYLIGLDLEFSLSGSTWQTSNIFTGLAPDSYTLHVRDQFGCTKTKEFFISEFGIQSPHFYISKSNSFRWANRIAWGDSANYKTDENTLSHEVDVPLPYREVQQFQSADVITTQFESNYTNISAKVLNENNNPISQQITKISNNIGLKDSRDAIRYNIGNSKTGIYFTAGNIYDYDLDTDIGDHALNGSLPLWGVAGNFIKYEGGWFLIEDIVYDTTISSEVLVIGNEFTGFPENIVVKSIYNTENYEVYEFTTDLVDFINQTIHLELLNSDDNFTNLEHHTEDINIKVKQENTLEIRYKNKVNTDVYYNSGIEHKIRLLIESINGKPLGESENYKTDNNTLLLNSQVYEGDVIEFQPVTKEIMRKIVLAFAHSDVKLNGVGSVIEELPKIDGALGETNLYEVTVTVVKSSSVFNSNNEGALGFNTGDGEISGLVDYGGGFTKYE